GRGCLSEEESPFHFEPLGEADREQDYLGLGVNPFAGRAEEVVLFSGGLDSLAGAALAVRDGRPAVLVNHRPNPKVETVVRDLLAGLAPPGSGAQPFLLPVRVNKAKALSRETTQRS